MREMLESEADSLEISSRHFYDSLRFPLMAVTTLWIVHIYQIVSGWDPAMFGIMSRKLWGITGILTGPMVHGSWHHLISNTFPLFFLSILSLYFYRKVAVRAFWMIYFLTGAAVWLLARPVSHIGASGVVYGLVAFIFWNGIFRRSLRSIILAGVVMLVYSGMFMGILPDQEGISWESHLLGSLAGIFASFWYRGELEDEELPEENPFADEANQEKTYFLPRDTFEKTRAERLAEEARAREQSEQNDLWGPPFWNQNSTW